MLDLILRLQFVCYPIKKEEKRKTNKLMSCYPYLPLSLLSHKISQRNDISINLLFCNN